MPDFATSTAPHRAELVVHCYRLLGSVHEAEDLVQETMLRAWRAWDRYDSARASVRTWLYRIATNTCLTALEGRARRPLPTGLGGPGDDPMIPLVPAFDVPWLQPFPDDPAAVASARSGIRLAFVAAMQALPARQRAVLVLRDVLDFSAAEVADLLDTTTASVNSALQRARAGVAGISADELSESGEEVIDHYVRAFEAADVDALVALLTDDVVMEMPPVPLWFRGRADYGRFLARVFAMRGSRWQLVRTTANAQPAFAAYCWDGADYRLHTLQVFSVHGGLVAHNAVFQDPAVFEAFGLAQVLG
ncbi:sigma-70 family RNA polymerase sigma factor [Amycolatopsis sp. FDAARGOS 1241]|uniref:sigma-70 family RNA polymerase sigma factor n=1 Tax=Amycolatopsis sp. FDAARGOS 1241 TaxID=2778070 RepID=UPI00194EBA34|nr:sigma-70 family RNA polymerase sigma factor [Amycolatopsis sp. FDAARGOS 1241]QRP48182.1 sigma-70 family RNA polymerase sigma factor [Amycolatopsis sp. FDAARGOS 1241]